ncbi:unnamed protein product [Mucor fragilis]
MLLRSGLFYQLPVTVSSTTTSTRSSRKRKSVDDELDERPLKRQETTFVLQGEPSVSHPSPLVASPSSPPPPSDLPFTRMSSCDSDATVPLDDNSSEATVALEDDHAGDERGPRRVHFGHSVIEYLFEADDEPCRVVDIKHFAYLYDEQ